ncbi:MAG TPA: ribosome biogenesis GTPase Der [Victivallales bacterium]|nr:ribosome biogenesis GTPase Der [Victivallales bacterium]
MNNTVGQTIPTIAIVGRPNVGKSSLFNAIIKQRKSIVHKESGVTRDRIEAIYDYFGKKFKLIDTGGLALFKGQKSSDIWLSEIRRQVDIAIESADKIIFMVEVGEPLLLDFDIANMLRASKKKIIVAVNKADNENLAILSANFTSLGFEKIISISCVHRIGIDELLDEITHDLPEYEIKEEKLFKISIVGRPNVGKSSLLNKLINDERVLVSEIPGTTRDAIETEYLLKKSKGKELKVVFVDTAGLRQKKKADNPVEIFSIVRTEKAIQKTNMALLVIEPFYDGTSAQDRRIGAFIKESGKACIIVVNKMDLIQKEKQKELSKRIRLTMPFLNYAPIFFVSALNGNGLANLCSGIINIANVEFKKPQTSKLNEIIEMAQNMNPASSHFKIYYITYIGGIPPKFLAFCNNPKLCSSQYLTFIENSIRREYPFKGYPINIILKHKKGR